MNNQDTTDIKQIDNKYRHLFNSLGDAIFVHDMTGRIIDANDYACRRYGYSYDKFQTMQVNEVDSPEQAEHIKKRIQLLLKNGHIIFETVHKDCHNSYFPVEVTAKLGVYEGEQVVLVIAHEITARKKIEKERDIIAKNLKAALDNIKTLNGLLPICSKCKKIRDDTGYWNQLESYIQKYSDANFSHGLCPECSEKLYGEDDWHIKMKKKTK